MERVYDIVQATSKKWREQLEIDVEVINDGVLRYDMLADAGAINCKTYITLQQDGKSNKKLEFTKTLNISDRYSTKYKKQTFIQKKEIDKICADYNYDFGPIAYYRGDLKDNMIKTSIKKRNKLDKQDTIFYVEDRVDNKSGFFSVEEMDENGYHDEGRYLVETAQMKVLAPLGLMRPQAWIAHPTAKLKGCAIFLHVVHGYLMIGAF